MKRTTIILPSELRARAKRFAKAKGLTFAQLVREALDRRMREELERDPLFQPIPFPKGVRGPRDGARNHDKYIYRDPHG